MKRMLRSGALVLGLLCSSPVFAMTMVQGSPIHATSLGVPWVNIVPDDDKGEGISHACVPVFVAASQTQTPAAVRLTLQQCYDEFVTRNQAAGNKMYRTAKGEWRLFRGQVYIGPRPLTVTSEVDQATALTLGDMLKNATGAEIKQLTDLVAAANGDLTTLAASLEALQAQVAANTEAISEIRPLVDGLKGDVESLKAQPLVTAQTVQTWINNQSITLPPGVTLTTIQTWIQNGSLDISSGDPITAATVQQWIDDGSLTLPESQTQSVLWVSWLPFLLSLIAFAVAFWLYWFRKKPASLDQLTTVEGKADKALTEVAEVRVVAETAAKDVAEVRERHDRQIIWDLSTTTDLPHLTKGTTTWTLCDFADREFEVKIKRLPDGRLQPNYLRSKDQSTVTEPWVKTTTRQQAKNKLAKAAQKGLLDSLQIT